MEPVAVLLLEDSALDAELTIAQIRKAGVSANVKHVSCRAEYENALSSHHFDLILADFALPDFDGLAALEMARKKAPVTPFIFVSGTLGEDVAIESLKNGATDYVLKYRLDRLAPAIRRALRERAEHELRIRREREAHANEAKFRDLANAMPQLVWAANARGEIVFCNRHAFEYGGERCTRRSPAGIDIVHPQEAPTLLELWRRALAVRGSFEVEHRLQRASDGAYRWHITKFVPMSENALPAGWLATSVDVEEQKNREFALLVSQNTLRKTNETLEQKVQARTKAFRHLSGRLLQMRDAERRRIAHDLHDSFGQYLAVLKINLEMLMGGQGALTDSHRKELLSTSSGLLDQCIRDIRTTSYLLHPPMLDEAGFAFAARWYVHGFGERSGISSTLNVPENFERTSDDVEMVMFRVLQEGLTNVLRHSGSRSVEVTVRQDEESVGLEIRDFGCGIPEDRLRSFPEGATGGGIGLAGMKERVDELGGTFAIESSGCGTAVRISIPAHKRSSTPAPAPTGPLSTDEELAVGFALDPEDDAA